MGRAAAEEKCLVGLWLTGLAREGGMGAAMGSGGHVAMCPGCALVLPRYLVGQRMESWGLARAR